VQEQLRTNPLPSTEEPLPSQPQHLRLLVPRSLNAEGLGLSSRLEKEIEQQETDCNPREDSRLAHLQEFLDLPAAEGCCSLWRPPAPRQPVCPSRLPHREISSDIVNPACSCTSIHRWHNWRRRRRCGHGIGGWLQQARASAPQTQVNHLAACTTNEGVLVNEDGGQI